MKFNSKITNVLRMQDGGPMPAEQGAPAQGGAPMGPEGAPAPGSEQGGGDQMQQMAGELVNMLMQQLQDPQAVAALLQMALEMVQQAGQPSYQRMGGKLVRVR